MSRPEINVGVYAAYSPAADPAPLQEFARRMWQDALGEMEEATRAKWVFNLLDSTRLSSDETHRPADFLDEASLRMVEGPFDVMIAVTDVALSSVSNQVVAGLASPVSRIAIISTRKLLIAPRGKPVRSLDSESLRWNAALLLLHLLGHILGLQHSRSEGDVMARFRFDEGRKAVAHFAEPARKRLERLARRAPEREHRGESRIGALVFHLSSAAHHPGDVLRSVWRSHAPLLPLALPSLATAAVAPTFLLVFTAEIWDVGLSMTNRVAITFSLLGIVAATWYLTTVQKLFYPRKEDRIVTEHMAVVNVTIFLTILFAVIGLFFMVSLLMLGIEIFVFPEGLIATWPTLENPVVTSVDKVRLAAFISTIGVLTGALAGGLESRTVIRHLSLFLDST
jgi:predicted Zn-dependent protease